MVLVANQKNEQFQDPPIGDLGGDSKGVLQTRTRAEILDSFAWSSCGRSAVWP